MNYIQYNYIQYTTNQSIQLYDTHPESCIQFGWGTNAPYCPCELALWRGLRYKLSKGVVK